MVISHSFLYVYQRVSKKLPGVRSRTFGQDEQSELDSHISFVDGKYLGIDIGDRESWRKTMGKSHGKSNGFTVGNPGCHKNGVIVCLYVDVFKVCLERKTG